MIRFCSVFFAAMLFAATAWAEPVNTYAIEGSQNILSQMTWLPDPQKDLDYASASSADAQSRYLPLTDGFGLQDTGPGWLRLELAKNDQQSSTAPTRVDKKSLYLNFNFLPSGKATLYKTGSFSSQPNTRHHPLATRVYPFQIERLAEPSISNAVYYIQLEETPGLWFNPTLSRTDSKSPILPHDLLLPSILLACLAFSLLRLAIDRTAWPVWAAAILVCVITKLLLPIPISTKLLSYGNLPVLMAPGLAVMIYAHLGRLLLYSPKTLPKADVFLKFYPLVGAIAALAPLVPEGYWLTRLFPLWGLLLLPLLVVATNALFRQLKGSFAYFVATFMPVLGACIALYGIFTPSIDMLAETGTFWGVAIGSFALIFARAAQPSTEEQKEGEKGDAPPPHAQWAEDTSANANEAGLDRAVAQNDKVAPLLVAPLAMEGEPNDIFTSLQYADLSGALSTPEAFTPQKEKQNKEEQDKGPKDQEPLSQEGKTAKKDPQPLELSEEQVDKQQPSVPQTDGSPKTGKSSDADMQAMANELRLDTSHLSNSPDTESPAFSAERTQPTTAEAPQKAHTAQNDDILDLDTLAEPSFLADISPQDTLPQKNSPLDWPAPEEFSSGVSQEIPEKNSASISDGSGNDSDKAYGEGLNDGESLLVIPSTKTADEKTDSDTPAQSEKTVTEALSSHYSDFQLEMPHNREDGKSASTKIIHLTDESLDDNIPENATRKVDAMLASLDGFKASSSTAYSGHATMEQEESIKQAENPLQEASAPTVQNQTASTAKTETTGDADIPGSVTDVEDEVQKNMGKSGELRTDGALDAESTKEPEKTGQTENTQADTPEMLREPATSLSADDLSLTTAASGAALPKDAQAVRERAYIEALLSTEDKPSSLDDQPSPVSPLIARYLQSHSEKEQEVLESYGGHCIIITEMTTSNKRLLQSYFNEIDIPCVEAKNIEDTTTIQAITGAPLVIYDADSPADAIIQSIQQLNQAAKPPKHLVLTSVLSQGKKLVEKGATQAITKPFTKEILFTAAQGAAPSLFPQELFLSTGGKTPAPALSATTQANDPAPSRPATPEQHSPTGATHLSFAEEAYIEELFGGHRQPKKTQAESDGGADKANEQRVDDLLAQLNGGEASPRSGSQTAEDQTASAISKMLSVDAPNDVQKPHVPYASSPATSSVSSAPAPKVKDSLLDFIVDEDENMAHATTASEEANSQTQAKTEGMHPLAGIEGEFIEQLMLPLIPGLLYALKDGLTDAETALAEKHIFGVQEAISSIASKGETFGLNKLEKIAQCVVRATSANDLEATTNLMEDMRNITTRYIESLEQSYEEYIQASRSTNKKAE